MPIYCRFVNRAFGTDIDQRLNEIRPELLRENVNLGLAALVPDVGINSGVQRLHHLGPVMPSPRGGADSRFQQRNRSPAQGSYKSRDPPNRPEATGWSAVEKGAECFLGAKLGWIPAAVRGEMPVDIRCAVAGFLDVSHHHGQKFLEHAERAEGTIAVAIGPDHPRHRGFYWQFATRWPMEAEFGRAASLGVEIHAYQSAHSQEFQELH